jgi:ankyrin repeat protein
MKTDKRVKALLQAAFLDDVKQMRELLDAGVPINAPEKDGDTALLVSAQYGTRKGFQLLLDAGADPHARNHAGMSVIRAAIFGRDIRVVQALLDRGVDVNERRDEVAQGRVEFTPLMLAVSYLNPTMAELLLRNGADANVRRPDGTSALSMAEGFEKTHGPRGQKLASLLRKAGATAKPDPVTAATITTAEAFWEFARQGDVPHLRAALAAGVYVDVPDKEQYTALLYAARAGHAEAFHVLREAGANLHARARHDTDVLECAAAGGNVELVRYLLGQGLPVDGHWWSELDTIRVGDHASPLIEAARHGHREVVRVLLDAGANVRARDAGHTALWWAKKEGHQPVVDLLIERGATKKDPAPALAKAFPAAAEQPAFQKVLQDLTALCGTPRSSRRTKGGYLFVLKKNSARLAERYPEAKGGGELLTCLCRDVRGAGFHLILVNPAHAQRTAKLLLVPTADKYAAVAGCKPSAGNYALGTRDILAWLRGLDRDYPFVLIGCGRDFVSGEFVKPIDTPKELGSRVAKFCPDLIDGDLIKSPLGLGRRMQAGGEFYLWWD